jgi:NIPSNAP
MAGVIEVRTYRAQPGGRGELARLLQDRVFPAQREAGMQILGVFPSTEDDDTLVWLRAFPDTDSRDAMTKAFYGGSQWTDELAGLVMPLIAEHTVVLIEDAPRLWDRWPS